MNKSALTLYHYWRSSCSWRVRWGLSFKGLSYQSVHVNLLKNEQSAEPYLLKNPLGYVPALEIEGKFLGESLAILEWLEEKYPTPPLLPRNHEDRALVRQMSLIIVAGTQPLQNLSVQRYFSPEEKKRQKDGRYFIRRGLSAFEKIAVKTHGKYAFGDEVTFADLCLVPQCYNAERFEIKLSEFPVLEKIYKNCRQLDSCKASEPINPEA